ncbi:MAG: hypothetical protein NC338_01360 [Firmicutes bacterium]|nr:hypothetical protein [Bacillota bacterium]MCM1401038.1 hypothetical protein [Bacteroides sp.]MCM1476957.1 hypothetical protein [Bacteroides sp.]
MELIELTPDAMLARWKRAHGFEPLRSDCTVTRTDGPDLDAMLTLQMNNWYTDTLLHAPLHMLPLTDIASEISMTVSPTGTAMATLPENCLRVASVMSQGWEQPALVVDNLQSAEALAQANPYAAGSTSRPVALVGAGWIKISPPPEPTDRLWIMAVAMPDTSRRYILTQAMLSSIKPDTY